MITIVNEGRGLTFHDWIDVYLKIPSDCIIGDFQKDLGYSVQDPGVFGIKVVNHESFWMGWLQTYRGKIEESVVIGNPPRIKSKEIPQVIKDARGIGAWWNPQYIIICDSVSSTSRLGERAAYGLKGQVEQELEYGHPYWNDVPRFARLRPFMESKRQLKFFYNLFSSCPKITHENSYVTSFNKHWATSKSHSTDLFYSEMNTLVKNYNSKVITLGTFDLYSNFDHWVLENPTFYGTWHGHGWRNYREKFCRLICQD